jgi:prepilin-type N-terminal cleavage/methylation domain-containing protein
MNVLQRTRNQAARGLTLIELVVVLAILVALVGLVLAFFPGLLGRASRSTSASSIQDVARAVQINYTSQLTYGTGYDSLLNAGGATLYSGLTAASSNQLTRATLNAADSAALSALGINTIYHLTASATDATFNVTQTATPVAVATGAPVATITSTNIQNLVRGNYAVQGTPVYVVLGVNKAASIVGGNSILQDAPVRSGANANENPTTSYQRYGLVFLIDGATARTARFLGSVAFASSGISTAEGNLQEYYSN